MIEDATIWPYPPCVTDGINNYRVYEPKDEVTKTLEARKSKYGPYTVTARIIQGLEQVMKASPKYSELSDAQKESLHMIANKIGRILNGDVNYRDSWVDIAGYAMLAVEVMDGKQ